jgi:hypothetical protein
VNLRRAAHHCGVTAGTNRAPSRLTTDAPETTLAAPSAPRTAGRAAPPAAGRKVAAALAAGDDAR